MKFDDFTLLIPVLISFLISVVLCPILIPFLRKLKFGQTVRDEGCLLYTSHTNPLRLLRHWMRI